MVPAGAVLRVSAEAPQAALRGSLSAPAATLFAEAEAWAATAAPQHAVAAPGQQVEGRDGGAGGWAPARPNRLWGLKKMLGKHQ